MDTIDTKIQNVVNSSYADFVAQRRADMRKKDVDTNMKKDDDDTKGNDFNEWEEFYHGPYQPLPEAKRQNVDHNSEDYARYWQFIDKDFNLIILSFGEWPLK